MIDSSEYADLQSGLSFLQHDPLVERVNAELVPGATLGESRLRIGVTERRPLGPRKRAVKAATRSGNFYRGDKAARIPG